MANFGETLRRERELRDISLREIADATKVNLRYLEALEQNRFDILPGGVFNKGFIRAYARFIGADGEAFVDSYLQTMAAREAQAMGGAAVPPPAGLHRPSESPKRRAGAEAVAPVEGPPGNGEPAAPSITFDEQTARPAVAARDPRRHATEAEATHAGARLDPRAQALVLSLLGVAAIAILGLWLVRNLRQPSPPRPIDRPPAASPGGPGPMESANTTEPEAAVAMPAAAAAGTAGESASVNTGPAPAGEAMSVPSSASTTAPGPAGPAAIQAKREPEPMWRDDTVDRPADPGGTPRPTAVPPRVPIAASVSPPPPGPAAAVPESVPPASGAMEFRIEATAPVWVQIACDGDDRLNRALQPGEGATLRCLSFIRLSVTDIGAVRVMVNGSRCAVPGERGARIEGFVIRAEDAGAICPNQAGAAHGRN